MMFAIQVADGLVIVMLPVALPVDESHGDDQAGIVE
jgi:hypothetical protein